MKIGIKASDAKWLILGFTVLFVVALATWVAAFIYVDTPSGWRHLALMYSIIKSAWWMVTRTMAALALLGILCLFGRLWRMAFGAFGSAVIAVALVSCALYATRRDTITERRTSVVVREQEEVEAFGRTYKGMDVGYFAWQMQRSNGFRWNLLAEVDLLGDVMVGKFFSLLRGFDKIAFKSAPQCIVHDYDVYACIMWNRGEHPVYLRVNERGDILDANAFAEAVRNAQPIVLEFDMDASAVSLERAVGRVAKSGVQEVYVSREKSSGQRDEAKGER